MDDPNQIRLRDIPGAIMGIGRTLLTFSALENKNAVVCFQVLPENHGIPVGRLPEQELIPGIPDFWIGFDNPQAIDEMINDLQELKGLIS